MAALGQVIFKILGLLIVILIKNVTKLTANPYNNVIKSAFEYEISSVVNLTEASDNFTLEEHTVITEDGYILSIFRIRNRECDQIKRIPIILMHGLIQSSDVWLDVGPDAGLAYLIAGTCYDLWLGNQRGNYYSRRHVQLDPDTSVKFWQFSVDEIGFYDIPATIDYVLHNTGAEKLNYIGYSQGAGTFFIMCSERPGYCDKVNILIALAPATRHFNSKSVIFRAIAEIISKLERVLISLGIYEIFSKGGLLQEVLVHLCKLKETSEVICGTVLGLLDSFHPGSINSKTLQIMSEHTPSGTSTHNMARYGQSMQTKNFQKFDYGKIKNLEMYGVKLPPIYNLTATTVPVLVLYGRNDHIVDLKDTLWLLTKLPSVVGVLEIADPLWNHFDMAYSQHIKNVIFPKVIQYLLKWSQS